MEFSQRILILDLFSWTGVMWCNYFHISTQHNMLTFTLRKTFVTEVWMSGVQDLGSETWRPRHGDQDMGSGCLDWKYGIFRFLEIRESKHCTHTARPTLSCHTILMIYFQFPMNSHGLMMTHYYPKVCGTGIPLWAKIDWCLNMV